MNISDSKTKVLAFTAILAALCCAATALIRIPTPLVGYIHAGDAVVYLSAFLLGPVYGAFAAGIGSALADLFTGYVIYLPATLVIKALAAFSCGKLCARFRKSSATLLAAAALSGLIVIFGYFFYDAIVLSFGTAAFADIPFNAVQTAFGVISSVLLFEVLSKYTKILKLWHW